MAVSRRKFLKAGTMLGLTAVVPLNSVAAVLGRQAGADQQNLFKVPNEIQPDERLTAETFSQYLNTGFLFYTSPLTAIKLDLIKVERWEPSSAMKAEKAVKLDSFGLLFRGPRKVALESRIYTITHDQMGTFDLFISPVNDHKKERVYQAVFSRLQK